jgi:hypothetical protein
MDVLFYAHTPSSTVQRAQYTALAKSLWKVVNSIPLVLPSFYRRMGPRDELV